MRIRSTAVVDCRERSDVHVNRAHISMERFGAQGASVPERKKLINAQIRVR
jgi:hypothetical protein